MGAGAYNGLDSTRATIPAPLGPLHRYILGWISFNDVNTKLDNETIAYSSNYANTDIYKIIGKTSPNYEFFLVENRQTGNYASVGTWDKPLNDQDGLLVWYINTLYGSIGSFSMELRAADGSGETNYDDMSRDTYRAPDSTKVDDCTYGGNLKISNDQFSSAQISGISTSGTSMTANLSPYRYGRLLLNESWYRITYIGDNLIIPPDSTLTISAGTIYIADGKKIEVYGTLKVTAGTVFTKTDGGTYWSGIDIKNGGTLEATSDFTIEYADCGIDLYSGASMKNGNYTVTIRQCRQAGIWANNTTTPIRNILCTDTSTSSYQNGAITVTGADAAPKISRCKALHSYYGIKIGSTFDNPMACVDSCIVRFPTTDAIVVLSNCRVDLDGYNNIHPQGSYKALNNPSSGSISANNNYWGSASPVWADIITFPDLVTKTVYNSTPHDTTTIAGTYKQLFLAEHLNSFYERADELENSGDWSGALTIYKNLISQETDPGNKKYILLSMLRITDNFTREYSGLKSIVLNESKTASSWYKASLAFLFCDLLLREGKTSEALSLFKKEIGEYNGTAMEVEMLARIAEIYGDYLGDKTKAKEYAKQAALLNPGQVSLRFAYASAGIEYDPWQYSNKFINNQYESQPKPIEEQEFVTVTPNPANPITTITYSIRNPSNVRLSIYSMNGQKVTTLVNGPMSAGVHAVSFDGSRYASGVYFYRFESAGLKKRGKMLLLK
jgi:hypothetical protein